MSAVFYKQWFKPVNETRTPNKNAEHIRYIGTRPGVMKNEGEKHGLFGNLYDSDTLEVKHKIKDVMDLVKKKSEEGKNIFRSVISFSPEDAAIKVGEPITKEAWQELIKQQIRIIAEGNNIKMSDFKWIAAAHDTPSHPHVHIVFWDERQEIQKNWVNPKVPNKIRSKLVKNIFEDELKEYYEKRDEKKYLLKDITNEMASEFEAYLDKISKRDYSALTNEEFFFDKPDSEFCKYLAQRLFEIRKEIPKGSLKFEYLKPDVKDKLISLVRELVDIDENLQEAISEYVQAKLDIARIYSSNEMELDAKADEYEKEAEKIIANKLLELVRKFIKKEWDIKNEEFEANIRERATEQLVTEIFSTLARLTKNNRKNRISRKHVMGGDLSKQARKEKAKEMESIGWDIEK
ncbi:MobP3 family relaxase [Ruminiclostridium papyrosolvens]|uniref:Uncharacterized protein n=1 Tax=Ruminiclostridium papyrosolvens C7 TaxID=1330534 RepID=U4R6W3_9FIRM|nr:MobP3 family relaxase [Ruminiclostridium papyrosolvens]EPR13889.1 hypothetical protein L323_02205 [Ruminiclostridium papyrosolvens C7]